MKVSKQMHSYAFKRRLTLSRTVIIWLKHLSTDVKSFITKVLEYKAECACIATHFFVMSPCLHNFLLTL